MRNRSSDSPSLWSAFPSLSFLRWIVATIPIMYFLASNFYYAFSIFYESNTAAKLHSFGAPNLSSSSSSSSQIRKPGKEAAANLTITSSINSNNNNITSSNSNSNNIIDSNMEYNNNSTSNKSSYESMPEFGRYLKYLDHLPHLMIHIPKAAGTYAKQELNNLLYATVRLPHNQSLNDIRHAQERYNQTNYTEGNFFDANSIYRTNYGIVYDRRGNNTEKTTAPPSIVWPPLVDTIGTTDAYAPPIVCNGGLKLVRDLEPYWQIPKWKPLRKCKMWSTEQPWDSHAKNVYTILREPQSHTISQYFHCTESKEHKKHFKLMPENITLWLEAYANILDHPAATQEDQQIDKESLNNGFKCYSPIDSESEFMRFAENITIPENYTYPYPYPSDNTPSNTIIITTTTITDRDEATKRVDKLLWDDLHSRYRVIGDSSQMTKTICAIFIAFTDGEHIPIVCDCSHQVAVGNHDNSNATTTTTFELPNLYTDPLDLETKHEKKIVKMGFKAKKHSHGVQHHGSSYLKELDSHTLELIAKVRRTDTILYNVSRAIFAKQVREMEAAYDIKICEEWNRPA
mmetsp:Transcript_24761/g.27718  ORF Transcript_24761/g.27718 Transcript_24761/m.27718 type:complete len:572 (+) Transcript_24761:86-1801(+)